MKVHQNHLRRWFRGCALECASSVNIWIRIEYTFNARLSSSANTPLDSSADVMLLTVEVMEILVIVVINYKSLVLLVVCLGCIIPCGKYIPGQGRSPW